MDNAEGFTIELDCVAQRLIRLLRKKSLYFAAAESCTGGLIADALTRIPGASNCFWGSFVCYTSYAKKQMLGIGEDTLNKYGEVSRETARLMALGALEKRGVDAAVSVTGLAGPDGGTEELPVGTVWMAAAFRPEGSAGKTEIAVNAKKFYFSGSRNEVRAMAAREALMYIMKLLKKIK